MTSLETLSFSEKFPPVLETLSLKFCPVLETLSLAKKIPIGISPCTGDFEFFNLPRSP
eukprot:UN23487